ncbi:AAA family ATPase [Croceiramulus getboli]|nr:ATP-binding protein [Flavobacteriaceae bacterium YJPT1-3]
MPKTQLPFLYITDEQAFQHQITMNDKMTVEDLTYELGLSRPDIIRYANCYNIDLMSYCKHKYNYPSNGVFTNATELLPNSYSFFKERQQEIKEHNNEFFKYKTVEFLCQQLNFDLKEFNTFYNHHSIRINSYTPHLGPQFEPNIKELTPTTKVRRISTQFLLHLVNGFPLKTSNGKSSSKENVALKEIIGYADFKSTVIDLLNPIKDSKALDLWGLRKPGGIILFGPPGCGKTFWANKNADYLDFEFEEIPRSRIASTLVDGSTKILKETLDNIEPRTIIFFDEFDSIAGSRSNSTASSQEGIKLVNTLLQEIPKLIARDVIIISATNYLTRIDTAVIRPGRFDLKIPIFPPNAEERAEIIYHKLTKDLQYQSPLRIIINTNKIFDYSFFKEVAKEMHLFSSSLIEDFVDTLKRRLKQIYDSGTNAQGIEINNELLNIVIKEVRAKLVKQDLEILSNFYLEVSSLTGSEIYQDRLDELKLELAIVLKDKKDPPRPIGFRQPKI